MLSIIIPTHNRADSLVQTIESILALRAETTLEIVVVDNNSTDRTPQELAKYANRYPDLFRCTVEKRTAFSRARKTGRTGARGEFLLYLDDDVLLVPGSLERIGQVFSARPEVGVIAGRIMPHYTRQPPPWTLQCQESFNGWSLFEAFA